MVAVGEVLSDLFEAFASERAGQVHSHAAPAITTARRREGLRRSAIFTEKSRAVAAAMSRREGGVPVAPVASCRRTRSNVIPLPSVRAINSSWAIAPSRRGTGPESSVTRASRTGGSNVIEWACDWRRRIAQRASGPGRAKGTTSPATMRLARRGTIPSIPSGEAEVVNTTRLPTSASASSTQINSS